MLSPGENTLPKEERLSGKTAVSTLISKGRWGNVAPVKYCFLSKEGDARANRLMVSVPKRFFKRAVKRNLLKRRLREAYRLNKSLLPSEGIDLMLYYNSAEICSGEQIEGAVVRILSEIDRRCHGERD